MKLKEKLLERKGFKKAYEKNELARDVAKVLIWARNEKGVTQEELAKVVGTKQSSIARVESGKYLPSLRFFNEIAGAYGAKVIAPTFDFLVARPSFSVEITSGNYVNNTVLYGSSSIKNDATSVENTSYVHA
ncbi:helix-turn-helix transcriptional regulator [Candidatus Uhrbacteria bacterium]|nr:helix-turn-helix transcriptional regulator [Candidatus Uhrbacteria bacterium]